MAKTLQDYFKEIQDQLSMQTTSSAISAKNNDREVSRKIGSQPVLSESAEYTALKKKVSDYEKEQPSAYENKYAADKYLNDYLNFNIKDYNINSDPLYQQYASQYKLLGNLAMQDTMGQAAQLSGGYGSSYAAIAGQQSYNNYLQQLGNMVPELANSYYNRQTQNQSVLGDKLSAVNNAENVEYARYRDGVSGYYTNRDYYTQRMNTSYQNDYDLWSNALAQWNKDRGYQYDLLSDEQTYKRDALESDRSSLLSQLSLAKALYQLKLDEEQRTVQNNQAAIKNDQWERNFAYTKLKDTLKNS